MTITWKDICAAAGIILLLVVCLGLLSVVWEHQPVWSALAVAAGLATVGLAVKLKRVR